MPKSFKEGDAFMSDVVLHLLVGVINVFWISRKIYLIVEWICSVLFPKKG